MRVFYLQGLQWAVTHLYQILFRFELTSQPPKSCVRCVTNLCNDGVGGLRLCELKLRYGSLHAFDMSGKSCKASSALYYSPLDDCPFGTTLSRSTTVLVAGWRVACGQCDTLGRSCTYTKLPSSLGASHYPWLACNFGCGNGRHPQKGYQIDGGLDEEPKRLIVVEKIPALRPSVYLRKPSELHELPYSFTVMTGAAYHGWSHQLSATTGGPPKLRLPGREGRN